MASSNDRNIAKPNPPQTCLVPPPPFKTLYQYIGTRSHSDPEDRSVSKTTPVPDEAVPKRSRKPSTISGDALFSMLMLERPLFEEISSEEEEVLDQPTDEESETHEPVDTGQDGREYSPTHTNTISSTSPQLPGVVIEKEEPEVAISNHAHSLTPAAEVVGVYGKKRKKTVTWAKQSDVRHFSRNSYVDGRPWGV